MGRYQYLPSPLWLTHVPTHMNVAFAQRGRAEANHWTALMPARSMRARRSRTALMSSPTLPDFQHEIGARMGRGDLAGASQAAAGCRAAWPSDRAGWLLGSIAALLEGKKEVALALVEERLATDPKDV